MGGSGGGGGGGTGEREGHNVCTVDRDRKISVLGKEVKVCE